MKTTSRTRYLGSIDRVVGELSRSLAAGQPLPSIAALARHAHLSEFHFMRIYRALSGESLGTTIQRLRLQRAAHLLVESAATITDIAARSGYETPQAFARAFRRHYGIAPGEVRRNPPRHRERMTDPPKRAASDAPPPVVAVEIVDVQPFRVAALRNHGDYADLDRAYTRLFQWMAGRGALESVGAIWGVPHHDRRDTPPDQCVFDCCLAIAADFQGDAKDGEIRITQLGGGRYATYRHVGSYARLDDAHDAVLAQVLFAAGLALRDAPILHEFLNDPESTPEAALETLIHVPVDQETLP